MVNNQREDNGCLGPVIQLILRETGCFDGLPALRSSLLPFLKVYNKISIMALVGKLFTTVNNNHVCGITFRNIVWLTEG